MLPPVSLRPWSVDLLPWAHAFALAGCAADPCSPHLLAPAVQWWDVCSGAVQLPNCLLVPGTLKERGAASSSSTPEMYGSIGSYGCMVS